MTTWEQLINLLQEFFDSFQFVNITFLNKYIV